MTAIRPERVGAQARGSALIGLEPPLMPGSTMSHQNRHRSPPWAMRSAAGLAAPDEFRLDGQARSGFALSTNAAERGLSSNAENAAMRHRPGRTHRACVPDISVTGRFGGRQA